MFRKKSNIYLLYWGHGSCLFYAGVLLDLFFDSEDGTACSSETSIDFQQIALRYKPEGRTSQSRCNFNTLREIGYIITNLNSKYGYVFWLTSRRTGWVTLLLLSVIARGADTLRDDEWRRDVIRSIVWFWSKRVSFRHWIEVRFIGRKSHFWHQLSHVLVTIDGFLDWMIVFIGTLFTQLGTTCNTALSLFYTLSISPVTHALGFSAFTSRILATDFSQSHWYIKSHMQYSFHSLINFLPFLLNYLRLPSPELDPILDTNSQTTFFARL
jgi:hypothetical protein